MKRLIVGLGLVAVLLIGLAVPALGAAVESTKSASVTVRSYISATVTDYGAAGVNFGSLDPGTSNNAEAAQAPSTGAVQVAVGAESNVVCKIGIKGTGDFSDGGTNSFALSNAVWDSDNAVAGATAMTISYAQIGTDTTPGVTRTQEIWHWLSIPGGQAAATYSSSFYYKADTTL